MIQRFSYLMYDNTRLLNDPLRFQMVTLFNDSEGFVRQIIAPLNPTEQQRRILTNNAGCMLFTREHLEMP